MKALTILVQEEPMMFVTSVAMEMMGRVPVDPSGLRGKMAQDCGLMGLMIMLIYLIVQVWQVLLLPQLIFGLSLLLIRQAQRVCTLNQQQHQDLPDLEFFI